MTPTRQIVATVFVAAVVSACGSAAPPASTSTAAASSAPAPTRTPFPFPSIVAATPSATQLDGSAAVSIPFQLDTAPIDVEYAFDSIWVVSHHRNSVLRIDPETFDTIAEIKVAAGPGWFAVTDNAIWVSSQMGRGLSRIDPITNTEAARAGMWPTCNKPVVALGYVWQMACDAHQLMRIDPATNDVIDTTILDYQGVGFVKGELILAGEKGLATFDPTTSTITPIGGPSGWPLGSDGTSFWLNVNDTQAARVQIADPDNALMLDIQSPGPLRVAGDHIWMMASKGALEIDIETAEIRRLIPIRYGAVSSVEAGGYLWATAYDADTLWRIEP